MALSGLTNLAISTVAAAPSPATSGTSLTLATGDGSRFPDPSTAGTFPVTIWPTATNPDPSNAEIALCTARSGDVLTITRAQEGSSARTVVVGDQVMLAVTKAVLGGMAADVQVFTSSGTWTKPNGAKWVHVRVIGSGSGGGSGRRGAAATSRGGGAGGASGTWSETLIPASSCDAACTVTVGAGGAGGAAITVDSTDGAAGGNGAVSSFLYDATNTLKVHSGTSTPFGASGGIAGSSSGPSAVTGGQWSGHAGGAGSTTAGGAAAAANTTGAGGGGGGGGLSSGDATASGGAGGAGLAWYGTATGGAGGTSGSAGATITSPAGMPGRGGGGGASSKTANAGAGGNGYAGSGGGGGGASLNGFNSGAGGNGGNGQVVVTTVF